MFGAASAAMAQDGVGSVALDAVIQDDIVVGYTELSQSTAALAQVAQSTCDPTNVALRHAFGAAFDDWIEVSHLRFGPSEVNDRAFALAFWPDTRGHMPEALGALIANQDPIVSDPLRFKEVSIAARGFYALEYLLYDPQFHDGSDYVCDLQQAIAIDIAMQSNAIMSEWITSYADIMRGAVQNDIYRNKEEAVQRLFTALTTGLEFTSNMRLGRPLGTFDRPRPTRAEARRSGRSLRHVALSLRATRRLAANLSQTDADLDALFARAIESADQLRDPVFAGVSDPSSRLRIEILKNDVDAILFYVDQTLGPKLGIAAGFNALDGD